MSIQSIIDKANGIIADAQALTVTPWPTSVNCRAGTVPDATAFTPSDFWSSVNVYHARQQADVRDGWLAQIGTSITQGMDVARTHHALVNLGIGGDTLRGVLYRLSGLSALPRCGGVVLEMGINDAGYESMANMQLMYDRLFAWLTGPLVCVSLVPQPACSIATCDAVNSYMASKCAGRLHTVYVDITTPLRDTDGWMKTSLSIGDRMHPNASGYAVIRPLVAQALQTVTA